MAGHEKLLRCTPAQGKAGLANLLAVQSSRLQPLGYHLQVQMQMASKYMGELRKIQYHALIL
jgi:hypothetical protein